MIYCNDLDKVGVVQWLLCGSIDEGDGVLK